MANRINPHDETWLAVKAWAEQRRAEEVNDLIEGHGDQGRHDKRRGAIRTLDELLELADSQSS